jgi:hypothetical protein
MVGPAARVDCVSLPHPYPERESVGSTKNQAVCRRRAESADCGSARAISWTFELAGEFEGEVEKAAVALDLEDYGIERL